MAILTVEVDAQGAIRQLNAVDRGLDRVGRSARGMEREVRSASRNSESSLRGLQNRVVALAGAFLSVRSAVNELQRATTAALQQQGLQNAFRQISGSAEGSAETLRFLRGEAERLGVNFVDLARSFRNAAAAARGTSLEGQAVRELFIGVTEASRVLGLTQDETNRAYTAFSQIIAKGKLSAEEVRQQLGEALPGSIQVFQRALGLAGDEFNKLLESGALLSEEVLPLVARQLRIEFAEAAQTASRTAAANFARFQNRVNDVRVALGNELLPTLNDVLGVFLRMDTQGKVLAETIGEDLAFGIRQVTSLAAGLAGGVNILGSAVGGLAAIVSDLIIEGPTRAAETFRVVFDDLTSQINRVLDLQQQLLGQSPRPRITVGAPGGLSFDPPPAFSPGAPATDGRRQQREFDRESERLRQRALRLAKRAAREELQAFRDNARERERLERELERMTARRARADQEASQQRIAEFESQPFRVAVQQLGTLRDELQGATLSAVVTFGDELARAFETGAFSIQRFASIAIRELTRLAIQILIIRPIIGALGGVAGGGGFAGALAGAIGALGSSGQTTPTSQFGGTFNRGQLFIAGENGPELIASAGPGRSRVTPVGSGGGFSVNNIFNFPGADPESFRRSQAQISTVLGQSIQNALRQSGR